jgi:hypothetical protein
MMDSILLWFHERIKNWTKPAASPMVSGILSDLTRSRSDLIAENALLRQQLIALNRQMKRSQLANLDRFYLVFLLMATTARANGFKRMFVPEVALIPELEIISCPATGQR